MLQNGRIFSRSISAGSDAQRLAMSPGPTGSEASCRPHALGENGPWRKRTNGAKACGRLMNQLKDDGAPNLSRERGGAAEGLRDLGPFPHKAHRRLRTKTAGAATEVRLVKASIYRDGGSNADVSLGRKPIALALRVSPVGVSLRQTVSRK